MSDVEIALGLPVTQDDRWAIASPIGVDPAIVHPCRVSPSGVAVFDRVLDLYDEQAHGICFCRGTFAAIGADIPGPIRRFDDRIHVVHFRDVDGTPTGFRKTWQDDGPTDMLAAMRADDDIGFDRPVRLDHVPTMTGESTGRLGYQTSGRLFAVGDIRGLLEPVDL